MTGKLIALLAAFTFLLAGSAYGQQPAAKKPVKTASLPEENTLAHQVRHQIQVLPYYSVFDYVTFTLEGGKVTLIGHVLRPNLRGEAEKNIKSIEGVTAVNNLIEVLPKSSSDDDVRRAVYRAVFEDSTLQRYAVSEIPAIHIIVKDGEVTLEGVVGNEGEKNLATSRASGVPGVASVKNNLSIHSKDNPAN